MNVTAQPAALSPWAEIIFAAGVAANLVAATIAGATAWNPAMPVGMNVTAYPPALIPWTEIIFAAGVAANSAGVLAA